MQRNIYYPKKIDLYFEYRVMVFFSLAMTAFFGLSYLLGVSQADQLKKMTFVIDAVTLPALFLTTNILMSVLWKKFLFFRIACMVLVGSVLAVVKSIYTPGIIDTVWTFLLATSCACTIGLYKGEFLQKQADQIRDMPLEGHVKTMVDYIRDNYKFAIKSCLQIWLALGASLGVSMTILFKDGFADISLKYMAVKMVLGFMVISIAAGIWIIWPMGNDFLSINQMVMQMGEVKSPND